MTGIVRLLMLTGARREEIAGMRRSEAVGATATDGNLGAAIRAQQEPSAARAGPAADGRGATAGTAPRTTGAPRELLFGEGKGPFSGWSRCKERLDGRIAKANGGKAIPPWVLHDLRRTFVTRLNDLGVEPHVIEALVNHASGSAKAGVAGVYNRSAYASQKRAALALWCRHLAVLVGGGASAMAAVVPLGRTS